MKPWGLKFKLNSKTALSVVLVSATLLLSSCNGSSPSAESMQPEGDIATEPTPTATPEPASPDISEIPVAEEVPLDTAGEPETETPETETSEAPPSDSPTAAEVAPIFESAVSEIQPITEIPILLPREVPLPDDPPIYAIADAEADRYEIELAFDPNCRGASACFYGMFAAKRTDSDYYGVGETFAETVELANGVTGYFNPMMCGASCAPPVMEWAIDGVRYRMSLKGLSGDDTVARAKMTELANSAIAGGGRSGR
ncbi:hypothetical protein [Baaleninema simplex]|uniref:hypothetical protein n=1 Tax=Baaleninema simplex TaxID=2862350 RepID=UPI00034508E1|nr:hypothetical protein [Baaleninema simplex]